MNLTEFLRAMFMWADRVAYCPLINNSAAFIESACI